jgi:hypothetical protein
VKIPSRFFLLSLDRSNLAQKECSFSIWTTGLTM